MCRLLTQTVSRTGMLAIDGQVVKIIKDGIVLTGCVVVGLGLVGLVFLAPYIIDEY